MDGEFGVRRSSFPNYVCKSENFDPHPRIRIRIGVVGVGGSSLPNSRFFDFELGLKWGVWSRANARPLKAQKGVVKAWRQSF